jgi:hypothetical protein
MINMRIGSKVNDGQVFVNCNDILKSLYSDLADTENSEVKKYIKGNIELWEDYEKSILLKAGIL